MDFPFWLPFGPYPLHPHLVLEVLAYVVGGQLYLRLRRSDGDALSAESRGWIVVAAILGAAAGSKLLVWLADPVATWSHRTDLVFLMGGKTILGALVGGLVAVEAAKKRLGIERSTGDLFAIPLAVGIAMGRIGCFLTGLDDHTYGTPTTLPWGIDFGDGLARHPTQLYEIGFLLLLTIHLQHRRLAGHREGDLFKTFLLSYCAWRFALGFLQPGLVLFGLNAIQWTCLLVLVAYARHLPRLVLRKAVIASA